MSERSLARVGILISGRGSNMVALLEAMKAHRVAAEPAVVVSNVPGAAGLAKAESFGVPTAVVDHTAVTPRSAHERAVLDILRSHRVDVVCLAGYLRRISPLLIGAYPNKMLNVHPALLPAFPGMNSQQQALDHGAKIAGCTVHIVDEQLDHGPIVLQAAVPVLEDDTVDSLSERILEQEHALYPKALSLMVSGRLVIEGRRVSIRP
jgi:phosphoribosylglycinamide formyltransferase-1